MTGGAFGLPDVAVEVWALFVLLQDVTRTGTYHAAITENRADFEGKVVMDVGAGSGILSLFAAQVTTITDMSAADAENLWPCYHGSHDYA